jgi:uncharacterized protein (DUF1684 family)
MNATRTERLQLADWRRQVAELYAAVRRMAESDPAAAHAHWRAGREALYREHPASPVPAERRAAFQAIHFSYDPRLRFELPVIGDAAPEAEPASESDPVAPASPFGLKLPISTGQPLGFERVGWLDVPFEAGERRLALFWLPEYSGGLFLPFRDGTNGRETYGGGRYLLDTAKGADLGGNQVQDGPDRGRIVVDFNFAYQPSCAFDPIWSCPLAPADNRLDLEVRAGERLA